MSNQVHEAATQLVRKGYSVIPCAHKDKVPKSGFLWTPYQERKPTQAELDRWFINDDSLNLGIVMGEISGAVCLDIDNPENMPHFDIPDTLTSNTGKGQHKIYKAPPFPIGNIKIPGLGDIKGEGGYIVAPPSVHPSGKCYEWDNPSTPLADLPGWIIDLATKKNTLPGVNPVGESATTTYGEPWFDDLVELAECREGGRNDKLNATAYRAGRLIAAGQLNEQDAVGGMIDACRQCGLWFEDRKQVLATIRSGITTGKVRPVDVPTSSATSGAFATLGYASYARENKRNTVVKLEEGDVPSLATPGKPKLRTINASTVKARAVEWIWPNVLARGIMTLLASDPGVGKSLASHSLASIISNGLPMPCHNERRKPARVVYISKEEHNELTVKPRLNVNKSNLGLIELLDFRTNDEFHLPDDVPRVKELITDFGDVDLLIIDPLNAYTYKLDMNDASSVRQLMDPIDALTKETNIATLCIAHTNKGAAARAAIDRVSGSKQIVAACRVVLTLEKDPADESRRVLMPIKNNLGPTTQGFAYHTELGFDEETKTNHTYAVWEPYPVLRQIWERSGTATTEPGTFCDGEPF